MQENSKVVWKILSYTRTFVPDNNPYNMGDIKPDMYKYTDTNKPGHGQTRTLKEWAEMFGIKPDTARVKATRTFGTAYGLTSVLSAEQWAMLYGTKSKQPATRPEKIKRVLNKPVETKESSPVIETQGEKREEKPQPKPREWWQTALLGLLMLAPAAASVQNMYHVTHDIGGDWFAAVCLTAVFSAAPFMFVLSGVKSRATGALVFFMVLYEAFCNVSRIYGGLTGFGKGGFPTRFLGLVTDIFAFGAKYDDTGAFVGYAYQAGTHGTALVLAIIMAILAAGTFYAAYFEINKNQ